MEATASQIIDAIGGTAKVAQLCEISAQAVCNWRAKGIPKPWRKYLQAVRPNVFDCTVKEGDLTVMLGPPMFQVGKGHADYLRCRLKVG